MSRENHRGFAHILVLLLVLLFLIVFVVFLFSQGKISNPLAPASKVAVTLQTQYQNPFDKNTQYANPFSQYKNPFDTAK